jgi:hypothetical protein
MQPLKTSPPDKHPVPGIPSLKFEQTMEAEHCRLFHCDQAFTSANYQVVTTPKKEWAIVVLGDTEADMRHNRKLQNIDELMTRKEVADANLSRAEVIAVVLYTGPMVRRLPLTGNLATRCEH